MAAAGKPVCRECKGGWDVGEGRISGINPSEVKGIAAAQDLAMIQKGRKKGGHAGRHK